MLNTLMKHVISITCKAVFYLLPLHWSLNLHTEIMASRGKVWIQGQEHHQINFLYYCKYYIYKEQQIQLTQRYLTNHLCDCDPTNSQQRYCSDVQICCSSAITTTIDRRMHETDVWIPFNSTLGLSGKQGGIYSACEKRTKTLVESLMGMDLGVLWLPQTIFSLLNLSCGY